MRSTTQRWDANACGDELWGPGVSVMWVRTPVRAERDQVGHAEWNWESGPTAQAKDEWAEEEILGPCAVWVASFSYFLFHFFVFVILLNSKF